MAVQKDRQTKMSESKWITPKEVKEQGYYWTRLGVGDDDPQIVLIDDTGYRVHEMYNGEGWIDLDFYKDAVGGLAWQFQKIDKPA